MAGFLALFDKITRVPVAEGYWIDIKEHLTASDYEGSQRVLFGKMSMSDSGMKAEPDTIGYQHELVFNAIVDWNLTDQNDVPLPLEPSEAKHASIRRLPQSVFTKLYTLVNDAATPRSGEEDIRFRSDSESVASGVPSEIGAEVDGEVSTGVGTAQETGTQAPGF